MHVALALGVFMPAAPRLSAQDVEPLYQKGIAEFNSAHVEDACDTLKQVESLKPGYQQVTAYMKMACSQVPKLYQLEQDNYNQGVKLFNEGKYEDARQAFQNVIKARVKNPKYRAQAQQYVDQINARQGDEKLFQDAARALKQNKFSEARADFSKLAQAGGPRAGDAKNMLPQVDEAERNYQQAKKNQISEPPKEPPATSDQSLRAGLQAYFNGEYEHAENSLTDYLSTHGPKQQLAFFFRGASHSAQYFLSGEKDSQEKELAMQDFRALKGQATPFQPPKRYVSPKILALYDAAVGASSQ